jgi:hypothetical protein
MVVVQELFTVTASGRVGTRDEAQSARLYTR